MGDDQKRAEAEAEKVREAEDLRLDEGDLRESDAENEDDD